MLVAHVSRKQKSYRLNLPLRGARPDRTKETKIQLNSAARGKNLQNWKYLYTKFLYKKLKQWFERNLSFLRFCRKKLQFKIRKVSEIQLKMAQLRTKNSKGVGSRGNKLNLMRYARLIIIQAKVRTNFSFKQTNFVQEIAYFPFHS